MRKKLQEKCKKILIISPKCVNLYVTRRCFYFGKKRSLFMKKIKNFFKEVKSELNKVKWPNRKDMLKYSIATISFVIFFAVFFYLIDLGVAFIKSMV